MVVHLVLLWLLASKVCEIIIATVLVKHIHGLQNDET